MFMNYETPYTCMIQELLLELYRLELYCVFVNVCFNIGILRKECGLATMLYLNHFTNITSRVDISGAW